MNNTEIRRPVIGITMGDPAGNGPELCVQALLHKAIYEECRPLIVGDANVIEKAAVLLGHPELTVHRVDSVEQAAFTWGIIDVYHLDLVDLARFEYGKVSAMCGRAAFECVRKVIELALDDEVDATCTNALNKEAMNLALAPEGMHFDGHTEIFATLTQTKSYTMMLWSEKMSVVHVSTHCSLRQACDRAKKPRILECIHLAQQAMQQLGVETPRIAVAGLNPHSGENGLFGTEDLEEIAPAVAAAQAEGLHVDGPVPPDTVFLKAYKGVYDIVVAMYHDQGHIPMKMMAFDSGVNVTLGLPIIRTSVDHGTAFDIAGKGIANVESMLYAVDLGKRFASGRH